MLSTPGLDPGLDPGAFRRGCWGVPDSREHSAPGRVCRARPLPAVAQAEGPSEHGGPQCGPSRAERDGPAGAGNGGPCALVVQTLSILDSRRYRSKVGDRLQGRHVGQPTASPAGSESCRSKGSLPEASLWPEGPLCRGRAGGDCCVSGQTYTLVTT